MIIELWKTFGLSKTPIPMLVVSFLLLSLPVKLHALPESLLSSSHEESCTLLSNQFIVLADLKIIQAIQDLLKSNSSGAQGQISLAQDLLDNMSNASPCH